MGYGGPESKNDLSFPTDIPEEKGKALVQIQRTIHSGRYVNGQAAPQAEEFDIRSWRTIEFRTILRCN